MADRTISYRLSLKDADTVKKALANLGDEGQKALKKIESAGEPASNGLKAVNAASESLHDKMNELANGAGLVGNVFRALGPSSLIAVGGIVALGVAVHKGLAAFLEMEESHTRLEAVLKATSYAAGIGAKDLEEYSEALERHSKFTAEQVADASSVLLTFKSVSGESFFRAQQAAADLAAVMKSDLSSATLQVGKALEEPVEGITALRRAGVTFTAEQKAMIASLVETGQKAEAQDLILKALEGQVGGTAEAIGTQGLSGALHQAGVASGDFFKEVGQIIAGGGILEGVLHTVANRIDDVTYSLHAGKEKLHEWVVEFDVGLIAVASKLGLVSKETAEGVAAAAMEKLAHNTTDAGEAAAIAAGATKKQVDAQAEHKQALESTITSLNKEAALNQMSAKDKEIQQKLTKQLDDLHKAGIQTSTAEEAQLKALIARNYDLSQAQKAGEEDRKKNKKAVDEYIISLGKEADAATLNARDKAAADAVTKGEDIAKKENIALTTTQIEKIEALAKARYDNQEKVKQDTEQQKQYNDVLKEFNLLGNASAGSLAVARLEQLKNTDAYRNASTEAKAYFDKVEQGLATYKNSNIELVKNTDLIKQADDEYKKLLESQAGIFSNASAGATDALENGISNGIKNGFGKGTPFVKQFTTTIRDSLIHGFAAGAAAIATMKIVNPIMVDIAGSISPELKGAVAQKLGVNQGGASSLLSLLSGGKSAAGLLGSGGIGAIGSQINSFGATLGFSSGGAPIGAAIGPTLPGGAGLLGGTTLTGLLGSAGIGAGIGALNLFGGNQTGSTVGGAIGGIAGSFIPVPVVGTLVGSAIGSAIGGLFGPGKAVSASEFGGSVSNGSLTGVTVGAKNADPAQAQGLSQQLGTLLSSLTALGVNLSDASVRGAINSKSGNRFEALGHSFGFDPANADSVASAMAKLAVELAKAGDNTGSLGIALQHIQVDGRKTEDILSDLNFAATFDQLGEVPEKIGQYEQAAIALNAQFDSITEKAGRLGLSLEKLAGFKQEQVTAFFDGLLVLPETLSPLQQQLKTLKEQFADVQKAAEKLGYSQLAVLEAQRQAEAVYKTGFVNSLTSDILTLTDPLAAQIEEENARYRAQLDDAKALGADVLQVEQLHYLKMKELATQAGYFQEQIASNNNDILQAQVDNQQTVMDALNEQASQAQDALKSFQSISSNYAKTLQGLQLSDLSTLSPEDKLVQARGSFESLAQSARLGSIDAMSQLEDAAKTFLENSRDFNASSGAYASDFQEVQDILGEVKGVADRQIPLQQQIYNTASDQLGRLREISSKTTDVVSAVNSTNSAISNLSKSLLDSFFKSSSSAGLFADSSLLPKGKDASYLDSMTGQGVTVRQYHILGRLAGYDGEYGAGGFDAWAKANPAGAAMFNQLLAAEGGSMRQFASGGITPHNQLFSVGERGRELMFSGDNHAVFSAEQSKKMLSGSSNDNRAVVVELQSIKGALQGLVRITAASGDLNNNGLAAIESRLSAIENKARLEAAS